MLSSGAIAEADGRTAASGGWGANVALALEADGSFDARQRQLHSGAAASGPAAGVPSCRFHIKLITYRRAFGPYFLIALPVRQ